MTGARPLTEPTPDAGPLTEPTQDAGPLTEPTPDAVTTRVGRDHEPSTAEIVVPHVAAACPECFTELQRDRNWWQARPTGSRLVGLVIARDDMPSVVEQRDDLTKFGVPIDGFRHPAPETLESWEDRLLRLFGTLRTGDVLVVANVHAFGRNIDEETRTVAELRRRGVVVKVVKHGGRHLFDTGR